MASSACKPSPSAEHLLSAATTREQQQPTSAGRESVMASHAGNVFRARLLGLRAVRALLAASIWLVLTAPSAVTQSTSWPSASVGHPPSSIRNISRKVRRKITARFRPAGPELTTELHLRPFFASERALSPKTQAVAAPVPRLHLHRFLCPRLYSRWRPAGADENTQVRFGPVHLR